GLSAIIDILTDIFGDSMHCLVTVYKMDYVYYHFILSVNVSNPCINKINHLRAKFRNDLPQKKKSKGRKRKIEVTSVIDVEPCS
uniref:Uncharacterized protein n=1 Tax=Amphimedon queenslandica TaxID=400682 RepID=A0A1X7V7E1_AMPQE